MASAPDPTTSHEPPTVAAPEDSSQPASHRLDALYPSLYCWFILFAVLDIIYTYLILHPATFPPRLVAQAVGSDNTIVVIREPVLEGIELNPVADWVIEHFDVPGKVVYKLLLVIGVIAICEYVGRRRPALGLRLAEWAVALTVVPVVVAIAQIARAAGAYGP